MILPRTVDSGRERDPRGCAAGSGSFCLFVKSTGEESTARVWKNLSTFGKPGSRDSSRADCRFMAYEFSSAHET
jgi:hypothetical protein